MYGILDDTRQVVIHENIVKVNPKTTFIATINEGLKYSGTFRLDEALRQRFDMFIGIDYPENEIDVYASIADQTTAEVILNILEKLRAYDTTQNWGIDVSTRTGVKIAKLMNNFGITMGRAIELAVHNSVQDQKIKKSVIDVVNSHIGACL